MSNSALVAGIRHLRAKLAQQGRQDESDEQLLHAFTSRRDDNAFAVLVRRHGPMVLHACRRVLGYEQDAEDAFQATFLVLARTASRLRIKTTLAGFLYGTAYRIAMKAKQSATRRRKHEGQALSRPPVDPADELSWREVRTLLDEEIARLPEIYRSVFVLCCVENLSQAEAGRHVGLKERTVSRRLAAARKRLAQRLARRGVELTAVLAATMLGTTTVSAAPPLLVATTVKAALALASGEKLAGIVSASVAQLVKSATTAVVVSKAKIAVMLLLTASMLAGASAWAYRGLAAHALTPSTQPTEPPAAKSDDKPKAASPQREAAKKVAIQGQVFEPDGKPKAGAKILLLGEDDKLQQLGETTADGRFTVAVPKKERHSHLIARSDGAGIDFIDLDLRKPAKPVELRLVKDNVIHGRVVNTEGKPVRGVRVFVRSIGVYKFLDSFLDAWKETYHRQSQASGHLKSLWTESDGLLAATSDDHGRFVLHGIGTERVAGLRISGPGIADAWADTVANRSGLDAKSYNQALLDNISKNEGFRSPMRMLSGPEMTIVAEAEKPLHGVVKEADTGKGRPNVVVRLTGITQLQSVGKPLQAKTDALGRYQIHGARKTKSYQVRVQSDPAAGYMSCEVLAADTPGYQPVAADITVKKGVIVTGKVIDRATGKSVPGFAEADPLINNPFAKEYPEFNPFWEGHNADTRVDGSFRIVTIPGPVLLMGGLSRKADNLRQWIKYKPSSADEKYPQYFFKPQSRDFFKGPDHVNYHGLGGSTKPVQGHFCKVLNIKPGTTVVNQDIVLERASTLEMAIEDSERRPLSGFWASGYCPENLGPAQRLEGTSCTVYGLDTRKPRLLVFYEPERKIVGTRTLKGDEKPPVVMKLGAMGALKGRLLDADGKPLAGVVVDLQYQDCEARDVHRIIGRDKQIVSDANGAFTFDAAIPELKFKMAFQRGRQFFERETKPADPPVQIKPGERRDLGAIKLKRISETAGG